MVQGKKIESLEISYIKLTNEINKEEPNYKIIASIIESDLDMSYKLLKIVNSYSLSSKGELYSSCRKSYGYIRA